MNTLTAAALAALAAATLMTALRDDPKNKKDEPVQLGNFCIRLNVKDVKASLAFYEKLDFKQVSGKLEQHWVVVQNGNTKIGLFQGIIPKDTLTFNPGWDHERKPLKEFQDVREVQRILKQRGIKLQTEADESTDGPASFTLADPDGNPILVDQHVPKAKK